MPAVTATATIPAGLIDAGPNDRTTFDATGLAELAESIAAHGLAQPPTLRPVGDRFEIVAGERRCRAMRDVLGWTEIPAFIRELDEESAAAIMLIENIQRADLDPMEEARAYASRMERFGSTAAELARLVSMPAERVRRRLALLNLAPEIAGLVSTRNLPLSYAAVLTPLDVNRQRLAVRAYQESTLPLETFRALCGRLLAEQQSETMFDAADFLRVEEYVIDACATVESASTIDEVDADPVGTTDIAERLGVKAQTVAQWRYRYLMPPPRWTVSGMPVWNWDTIEEWARANGRLRANA